MDNRLTVSQVMGNLHTVDNLMDNLLMDNLLMDSHLMEECMLLSSTLMVHSNHNKVCNNSLMEHHNSLTTHHNNRPMAVHLRNPTMGKESIINRIKRTATVTINNKSLIIHF